MASSSAVLRQGPSPELSFIMDVGASLARCVMLAENACNSAQATTSWPRPVAGDFGENGEKKEDNLFEISEEMSAVDWAAGRSSSVSGERLISVSSIEPADATAGAPSSEVGDEGGIEPGASSCGLRSRLAAVRPPAISISTAEDEMTVLPTSLLSLSAERFSFLVFFAGEGLEASTVPPRLA